MTTYFKTNCLNFSLVLLLKSFCKCVCDLLIPPSGWVILLTFCVFYFIYYKHFSLNINSLILNAIHICISLSVLLVIKQLKCTQSSSYGTFGSLPKSLRFLNTMLWTRVELTLLCMWPRKPKADERLSLSSILLAYMKLGHTLLQSVSIALKYYDTDIVKVCWMRILTVQSHGFLTDPLFLDRYTVFYSSSFLDLTLPPNSCLSCLLNVSCLPFAN